MCRDLVVNDGVAPGIVWVFGSADSFLSGILGGQRLGEMVRFVERSILTESFLGRKWPWVYGGVGCMVRGVLGREAVDIFYWLLTAVVYEVIPFIYEIDIYYCWIDIYR